MTRIVLALAIWLTALTGPAMAQTSGRTVEPTAVLVWFDTLRLRSDLAVDFEDEEDDLCLCEVYEADVTVLRNLGGPPLPRRSTILFVGHALASPDREGRAMIMNVRPGRDRDLWAGMWWDFVDADSCVGPDSGGGWSVLEPSSDAVTCTRVHRLVS